MCCAAINTRAFFNKSFSFISGSTHSSQPIATKQIETSNEHEKFKRKHVFCCILKRKKLLLQFSVNFCVIIFFPFVSIPSSWFFFDLYVSFGAISKGLENRFFPLLQLFVFVFKFLFSNHFFAFLIAFCILVKLFFFCSKEYTKHCPLICLALVSESCTLCTHTTRFLTAL